MKIGVITDLHLGLRQYGLSEREHDFYEQYYFAVQTLIDQNVDAVIIGGDIFDQARPSPLAMKTFLHGLNNFKSNGIQVMNIIGNHAMIQSPDFVTADEFIFNTVQETMVKESSVTNNLNSYPFVLLNENNVFETDDVFICGLPYFFNFALDELIEEINKLNGLAAEHSNKKTILVLHQEFKEYCGYTGASLSIDDIDISNFDLLICGHIHNRVLTETSQGCIYLQPGSIERCSVAEARDEEKEGKGVYVIDTSKMDLDSLYVLTKDKNTDYKMLILKQAKILGS